MSAPRGCSVCRDPRAPEIDAVLAKGVPNRAVGTRYGLGRMAIQRHRVNHLPERVRAAAKAHQGQPADEILERLRVLHGETREILAEARSSKDHDASLKAVARLERQMELEAKLLGIGDLASSNGGTTNVVNVHVDQETGERIARAFLARALPIDTRALPAAPAEAQP